MTSERKTHIIDASAQPLGRLASRIAILLRGKHRASFQPQEDQGDFVIVEHIKEMKFTGSKFKQKIYYSHSGYPGGIHAKPLARLFTDRPTEVLRKAVWGMLPKNKLRARQIKRLKFT